MSGPFTATRRRVSARRSWAVTAALALVVSLVTPTAAAHAATAPKGKVVLDPDDNYSHAVWGGTTYTELPITYAIAQAAKAKLEALCDTSVVISRDASTAFVDRSQRAALMANADVSLTISLNNLTGSPWGTAADGGAQAYATANANSSTFGQKTLDEWSRYTGRPNAGAVNAGGTNGTLYPYPEFAGLPGTYAQTFFGFLDHNFDAGAIGVTTGDYHFVTDAVVTAVGRQLQAQGIGCGDTSTGQAAFPTAPSAAQLAALFALGFANWMRFGSDPVNFATGNFLQTASLFSLSGPGGTDTSVKLTYNSLDPRSGRFGHGWSSGLDTRTQTYADKSVLVTGADGAASAFTSNGDNSFTANTGVHNTLVRTAEHTLLLTTPDSSSRTFTEDADTGAGVLTSKSDRQGHAWTYSYDTVTHTIPAGPNPWPLAPDGSSGGTGTPASSYTSLGALTAITDPAGQRITFTNDATDRVTSVSRPDGAKWVVAYDSAGNLTSIADPLGHTTGYGYDAAHRMSTVTAPDGTTYVSNTFDEQGRVVKQVNGDGRASHIAYNQDGTTTYADTTGAQTVFTMDSSGRISKVTTPSHHVIETGYSNWDTATSTDGNGHRTSYVYDSQGRLVEVGNPAGEHTSYTYTAQGDLTSRTDPTGATTSYTVDGQGRTTAVAGPDGAHWQQSFDAQGNLTSRTDPDGHTTRYGYDPRGNLTTVTDALSGKAILGYDKANRLVSATDPLGRTTTFAYDAAGNLTSRADPAGAVTRYTYQADDKVVTVTDPRGGVTSYTYNHGLNLASVTAPDGGVTSYGYDSEYRRTLMTDPDGRKTVYAYDAEGLVTSITDPAGKITKKAYDAAQNLTSVTDPTGAVTSIGYHAADRPTQVTDPRGGTTGFSYDAAGRITSVTDPLNRTTSYSYDAAGRVVTVTDPAGATQKYSYDPAGNQTSSTDPTNRATSLAFDALNRVIGKTDPAGAETSYGYDAASELTSITDPAGRKTTYGYDAAGRLASSVNGAGDTSRYAYDPAGNITGITDRRGGSIQFGYDPNNRLSSKADQNGNTTSWEYTPAGVVKSMTDPLGLVTQYAHDPRGLLTKVIQNATGTSAADANLATNYSYDDAGRLTSATDPAGHVRSWAHDLSGNVTSVTDPLGKSTGYSYDAANQLTARVDANGKTTSFGYDPAARLTAVSPKGETAIGYVYDAASRMTGMTDGTGTSAWTYNPAGWVATQTDGHGKTLIYGYDASGLRSSLTYPDGTKADYGRDQAGRITSLATGGKTTSYSYDPASELTKIARPNGTTTNYAYDPAGRVTRIQHTAPTTATPQSLPAAPLSPEPANPTPTVTVPSATGAGRSVRPASAPAGPAIGTPSAAAPSPVQAGSTESALTNPATQLVTAGSLANPLAAAPSGTLCTILSLLLGCTVTTKTAVTALPLTLDYGYDKDGRVASQRQTSGAGVLATDYGYDGLGRLTGSTRSDGQNASYAYNSTGDRTRTDTTDPVTGAVLSTTATFNAADQLTRQVTTATLGSHTATVTTSNTFDANGNLTTASTTKTSSDSNVLTGLLGGILGSLFGLGNNGKPQTTSHGYNFDNKLTQVSSVDPTSSPADPAAERTLISSFSYDGLGRATRQAIAEPHHTDRLLQLDLKLGLTTAVASAGVHVGVDVNGQPCSDPRDTSATCRTSLTPFAGHPTDVTYDGLTPIAWCDTTTSRTINTLHGPEGVDQQSDSRYGTSYFHLDLLGSPRALTNSTGATVAAGAYDDWGNPQPAPGQHQIGGLLTGAINLAAGLIGGLLGTTPRPPFASVNSATPLGYTSQVADPAQGLLHFHARSYTPNCGAWLQSDPWPGRLDRPSSLNKYDYTENNPATYTDLLGYMRPTDDGGPGGIAPSPCLAYRGGKCYSNWADYQNDWGNPGGVVPGSAPTGPGTGNNPGDITCYTDCGPTPSTNAQNPAANNGHYGDCHGFWGCLGHDAGSALNNVSNWVDDAGGFIAANGVQISRMVGGALLAVGGGLICTADGVVTVGTGGAAALVGVSELAGAACVGLVGGGVMIMQNAANGIHGTGGSGGSSGAGSPTTPSESPIWTKLQNWRGKYKTNGLGGNDKRYYNWDYTHNDIEMYDKTGRHLGSMDPVTGQLVKPPVPGRSINVK